MPNKHNQYGNYNDYFANYRSKLNSFSVVLVKIRTLRHIDRNLWVQIVQLFSNNEVDLFVVGLSELVNVSMFGNNDISAIKV